MVTKSEFYQELQEKASNSDVKFEFISIQLKNHINYIDNHLNLLAEDGINGYSENLGRFLFRGISKKIDVTEEIKNSLHRYYEEKGFNVSSTINEDAELEVEISWSMFFNPYSTDFYSRSLY